MPVPEAFKGIADTAREAPDPSRQRRRYLLSYVVAGSMVRTVRRRDRRFRCGGETGLGL